MQRWLELHGGAKRTDPNLERKKKQKMSERKRSNEVRKEKEATKLGKKQKHFETASERQKNSALREFLVFKSGYFLLSSRLTRPTARGLLSRRSERDDACAESPVRASHQPWRSTLVSLYSPTYSAT